MPTSANQSSPTRSAPLWRRFAALGYDSLILMALSMGYGALITSVKVALDTPAKTISPCYTARFISSAGFLCW